MLDELRLKNFQCHESKRIIFDPEITTIIGPSDSGKSALLRAVRWLALNRPSGDSFIREGAELCRVGVKVDGQAVVRDRKRRGLNQYRIGKQKYQSFGTDVPDDVKTVLGLGLINFQGQHDAPYWFSLSAPEVARRLNDIANLSAMDRSLGYLADQLRSVRSEEKVVTKRVEELGLQLLDLQEVPKLDRKLQRLEELDEKRLAASEAGRKIGLILDVLTEQHRQRDRVAVLEQTGRALLKRGRELKRLQEQRARLRDLAQEAHKFRGWLSRPIPDLDATEANLGRLKAIQEESWGLGKTLASIESLKENLGKLAKVLAKAETLIKKETQGRCPVCGGEYQP